MPLVRDLYNLYKKDLELNLIAGKSGLLKNVLKLEIQRPGIYLTGFDKHFSSKCFFIFGLAEIEYLNDLKKDVQKDRLKKILSKKTFAVIVADNCIYPNILLDICKKENIAFFTTSKSALDLSSKMTCLLHEWLAPNEMVHGTLMEVFGIGVLIQGESCVGKSETALGLLEKGHKLISDDIVKLKKRGTDLIGSGPKLTRYIMEIRGVGIINVAHLFGAICVKLDTKVELIVKIEKWKDGYFYDRLGIDEKFCNFLGISIPFHVLPVKPGRDIILLIETLSLNHRLKVMGYHSAKEFKIKLQDTIKKKVLSENCKKIKSEK